MLPNFFVIGAMKAGTTSLYQYLRAHPQIFMADDKEPCFFGSKLNWHRGREWYESLFHHAGDAIAVGEACTGYTKYPIHDGVPERMSQLIPEARLIYLVRHPIERIRSHYEHVHRYGYEKRPLAVAVLEDPKYVGYSRYALQIDQYLKCFAREQLLVVTSENLRSERRGTLRQIFDFLGVDGEWSSSAIDVEHYASRRRVPRPFARQLRRLPGYRRVARAVPSTAKTAYRRVAAKQELQAPVQGDGRQGKGIRPADIPRDVRRELEDRLSGDVARLRDIVGNELDGWGIG
jgi:hypothetical protein